ncbi:CsgG/HfaB family protein [Desulfococcaceae bacterium HSG8]|nr:CsgG/HfaB family protein [Desulfococcaceae bacterium HSG8]
MSVATAQGQPHLTGTESEHLLREAKKLRPDNYAVFYYLGLMYLKQGNPDKAMAEWESYLKIAPDDSKSATVREQLTVFRINQAKEYAREAVNGESQISEDQIRKHTLAVLNFNYSGPPAYNVLSKGITAMIITDLANIPQIHVVERVKMQALLEEIRLGQTGIINEETAVRAGKLLLARHIVRGEISDSETRFEIYSVVTETLEARDLGNIQVDGPRNSLFRIEKKVVYGILEVLGIKEEDIIPEIKKAIEKIHTRSFEALLSYSLGLDYQDRGMFAEAGEAFEGALNSDPEFDMAEEALISNPGSMGIYNDARWTEAANFSDEDSGSQRVEKSEELYELKPVTSPVDDAQNRTTQRLMEEEAPPFPGKP